MTGAQPPLQFAYRLNGSPDSGSTGARKITARARLFLIDVPGLSGCMAGGVFCMNFSKGATPPSPAPFNGTDWQKTAATSTGTHRNSPILSLTPLHSFLRLKPAQSPPPQSHVPAPHPTRHTARRYAGRVDLLHAFHFPSQYVCEYKPARHCTASAHRHAAIRWKSARRRGL
jgi:hypothetical protein